MGLERELTPKDANVELRLTASMRVKARSYRISKGAALIFPMHHMAPPSRRVLRQIPKARHMQGNRDVQTCNQLVVGVVTYQALLAAELLF